MVSKVMEQLLYLVFFSLHSSLFALTTPTSNSIEAAVSRRLYK